MSDEIALGESWRKTEIRGHGSLVLRDQMTELIRSIGEGGAKPSWEDARQFLLISSTEIKRGGPIPMGTRVELLLPWWMRGMVSVGVEKGVGGVKK